MEQSDRAIADLKAKVLEQKLGRAPLKAPSLDSIHRAIRNMTSNLHARNLELDDLVLRLDMSTMSTSSPAKSRSQRDRSQSVMSNGSDGGEASSPSASPRVGNTIALRKKQGSGTVVEKRVKGLLDGEVLGQRLKAAWLANGRTQPLLNISANSS